ncbi:MAG: hypothetical protein J7641_22315 [Cyanobacteria bacterium SID2]|nr:hypothetical protein [Cyanobacteria bacterium SID2]
MYSIAFFLNHQTISRESIVLSLVNLFSEVWLCGIQDRKKINSQKDLSEASAYFDSKCWYIHGQILEDTLSYFPKIFIKKDVFFKSSLEEVEIEFQNISSQYTWIFFSWGYPIPPFSSFGFLSKNRSFHNQFIDLFSGLYDRKYIISTYERISSITDSIRSIILGDYAEQAHPIWELFDCKNNTLLAITELWLDKDYSIYTWWNPSGITWIKPLKLTIEYPSFLQVYRISNKSSLVSMCMLETQQPNTLIFVPETANLKELEKFLSKTEDRKHYSDLIYLQDILRATQWFYGVGRDLSDLGISLLAARDPKRLQRFDSLHDNPDYRLISCF